MKRIGLLTVFLVLSLAMILGMAMSTLAKPGDPAFYRCNKGTLYYCTVVQWDPEILACECLGIPCSE